jgi:hypothetical protein
MNIGPMIKLSEMPVAVKKYNSRPMKRGRGIKREKIIRFKGDRKDITETESPTDWLIPSGYGHNAGRNIGMMKNN